MSQAIVQSLEQLLQRNDVLPAAIKAAKDLGSDDIHSYALEALRFNPITAMQIRYAERDCQLGVGTPYATKITRGSRIAACTGPAMFDEGLFREASAFKVDRPRESYLHLGFGHHECLGKYVALVAIPETVRHLLSMPGIRRAAGDSGKIDFAGGPFPEHFSIEWDQAKLQ